MLSRNRSICGIRPYLRATCNPDADSWVSRFIAWFIDEEGYPIWNRSGVLRYFVRDGDRMFWGGSPGELWDQVKGFIPEEDFAPVSMTFIPARLQDNPALISADPGYRARLLALPLVDRERLLNGNWKIRPAAGTMFRSEWFRIVEPDQVPGLSVMRTVRAWDTAATEEGTAHDPDWTAGVLMGEYQGRFYVLDLQHTRKSQAGVEALLEYTRDLDGRKTEVVIEQEPGSAAKREAERFKTGIFKGHIFKAETTSGKGNKIQRAKPLSAAAENGLVSLVRAPWNYVFINELSSFPDPDYHDDITDASSAAFDQLTRRRIGSINLEGMLQQKKSYLRG
jgi:predicted phage terminase large subunit-like protein